MSFSPTVQYNLTVQLDLTHFAGGFKSPESMQKWIQERLNADISPGTPHVQTQVTALVANEVAPKLKRPAP
jgi:hypothetical protein